MARMKKSARLKNLEKFQNFISDSAKNHLEPERIQQIQLASEEALVNIFSYAYPEGVDGEVTVICDMEDKNNFCIKFEDHGKAFDMLSVEAPDTEISLDERSVGGLGILFIRQLIDKVSYSRADGKNILTFIIHLSQGCRNK